MNQDMENTIITAFSDPTQRGYGFHNPELVDVQDRFRLIEVSGNFYVVKQSSTAHREVQNALQADQLLKNTSVWGVRMKVVVPQLLVLRTGTYLVTPYLGKTLQSLRYEGLSCPFNSGFLFEVLQLLKDKGICHRGLLPRNLLMPDAETLYFIDWEDAVFYACGTDVPANLLCETNFHLNWMYFFDGDLLQREYRCIMNIAPENEPPLIRYEQILCALKGIQTEPLYLARLTIKEVVLFAEQPWMGTELTSVLPNDCGSLVADMFHAHIDAFFDLLAGDLRRRSSIFYPLWLDFLGTYIRRHPNTQAHTLSCVLLILLMMGSPECEEIAWDIGDSDPDHAFDELVNKYHSLPLVRFWCSENELPSDQLLYAMLERICGNCQIRQEPDAAVLLLQIQNICRRGKGNGTNLHL